MPNLMDNEIASTIDAADAQARYDSAARNLVAQKSILAYILKSTLDEFSEIPVQQIAKELIEGTPQVQEVAVHQDHPDASRWKEARMSGSDRISGLPVGDISIREGSVWYDIRFTALVPKDRERIEIIINIELQNRDTPGYPIPKRGIYYGARLLSAQRGTVFKDQEYDKIKKVVSIWICESTALTRSDSINVYRLTEHCRRGAFREKSEHYDLMEVIVMRLGSCGEESTDNAIRLLSKVFSIELSAAEKKKALSQEFHIDVTEEISQEVSHVCNLSAGIWDKGIAQGRLEGRKEGHLEGRKEGRLEMLFHLVKSGLLSLPIAAQEADMKLSVFEQKYREYNQ